MATQFTSYFDYANGINESRLMKRRMWREENINQIKSSISICSGDLFIYLIIYTSLTYIRVYKMCTKLIL